MIPSRGVSACSRAAGHATRALPCEAGILAEVAIIQSRANRPYSLKSAFRRWLTSAGLALPRLAFITWPTKKPNSLSLPAL